MSEYIKTQQKKIAKEVEKANSIDLDSVVETTIKDTLQTLLDSEEMEEWDENANDDGSAHNHAITAIRDKINSMLDA